MSKISYWFAASSPLTVEQSETLVRAIRNTLIKYSGMYNVDRRGLDVHIGKCTGSGSSYLPIEASGHFGIQGVDDVAEECKFLDALVVHYAHPDRFQIDPDCSYDELDHTFVTVVRGDDDTMSVMRSRIQEQLTQRLLDAMFNYIK